MTRQLRTIALSAGAFAMALGAVPASAQFRNLLRDSVRGAQSSQAAEGCENTEKRSTARGVLGGILGGAARRTVGRVGLGVYVPVEAFTDTLAKEIACKLDAEEQAQAAEATIEITEVTTDEEGNEIAPQVGSTASWTSKTREGVSGTSTVTAREGPQRGGGDGGRNAGGGPGAAGKANGKSNAGADDCITVTDVIIVDGEETRADKRMCRLAGSPRYTIRA